MTSAIYILSIFLLLPFFMSEKKTAEREGLHPFYVSVMEVEQNTAEKSIEVSFKFFPDDFEHTLEKVYKTSLDIALAKDKAAFDKHIPDYISRRVNFVVDGKQLSLQYIGYEVDKESVYCYFEIVNAPAIKKLDVSNSLLYDLTKDQMNIMHFAINGKRQSTKLAYPATKAGFTF